MSPVEVGQTWRRKLPKKQVVRVERVWVARRNLMDEVLGLGKDGDPVLCVRCHPLNGGKPQVMPVSFLEAEFDSVLAPGEEPARRDRGHPMSGEVTVTLGRALAAIDGIEAAFSDHYYGGEDERAEHTADAIAEARTALEATEDQPKATGRVELMRCTNCGGVIGLAPSCLPQGGHDHTEVVGYVPENQSKGCGGSGEVDWTFGNPSPKVPCTGCSHPDCPNKAPEGAGR